MQIFTVIYDACILYPRTLRTVFIELAMAELFQAKWTDEINTEWKNSLLKKNKKASKEYVDTLENSINKTVPDCLVTKYEQLIPTIHLPDPSDHHVLAAAIKCGAQAIITNNLKDFPEDKLIHYDIEALDPDTFIRLQFDLSNAKVLHAIKNSKKWLAPTSTPEEFFYRLTKQGLVQTVSLLRSHQESFSELAHI